MNVLIERWQRELGMLGRIGRRRALQRPRGVDFTSNDYLALGAEPVPESWLREEAFRFWSGTASRLLRGHHPLYEAVEAALARWHGAEAVLLFNSGYTANEGLLSTLIRRGDWVASDELNHASIIDGLRLAKGERYVFRHNDLDHLEEGLRAAAARRPADGALFIVTESIFSMNGDRAPLVELAGLAARYEAALIVDEAHATGCYGPEGQGLVDELGIRSAVLATVHTGGKALACCGAYVCSSALLRDYLINRCRHLIYTTALPPAVLAAWLWRVRQVAEAGQRRARLHALARFFRERLLEGGVQPLGEAYIVPVVLGDDARAVAVARRLQQAGYDVRPIRPPTVPLGTARLRLSIHADHDERLLGAVADVLVAAVRAQHEATG